MTSNTTDRRTTFLVWGALVIVYVVWGSTYLGIRIAVETLPALLGGALRFLIAAAVLAVIRLVHKGWAPFRMTGRQFLGATLVGLLLLTTGNGLLSVAEKHMPSGLAALLIASVPLCLVVMRLVVKDRPQVLTLAGVLVGFCGVAALSLGSGGQASPGDVAVVLIAAVSWSLGSFLSARIPMPSDSFAASTIEMLAGGAGLVVIGLATHERLDLAAVSTRSWVALAYLVVFGSLVAFTAYSWLLGNAPISLVSTYAYVNPVVAVLLGVLILNEEVTTRMIIGGLVIVAGVILVVSTERKRKLSLSEVASHEMA